MDGKDKLAIYEEIEKTFEYLHMPTTYAQVLKVLKEWEEQADLLNAIYEIAEVRRLGGRRYIVFSDIAEGDKDYEKIIRFLKRKEKENDL